MSLMTRSVPLAEIDYAVSVLRLLGDPTRLAILTLLEGEELASGVIAETLGRPAPAVSQHLAKLKAGNLVVSRRDGAAVLYSQPSPHVAALVTNVLQHAEHALYEVPPHHRRDS